MPTLHRDTAGVSVIIGALLLVVIVVAAASAFALFTSQKQGEIQQANLLKTRQSLEDLRIISITPTNNSTATDRWTTFNFTIASIYPEDSTIIGFFINDHQLQQCNITQYNESFNSYISRYYNLTDFTAQIYDPVSSQWKWENAVITLHGRDQITLRVNVTDNFTMPPIFLKTDIVKLNILTQYGNSFNRTFIPPNAIIKLDTESLPNGSSYYILDGSNSDQPGDGYIVKWAWTITDSAQTPSTINLEGRKTQISDPSFIFGLASDTYSVTLTVTNNYGMEGTLTTVYHF